MWNISFTFLNESIGVLIKILGGQLDMMHMFKRIRKNREEIIKALKQITDDLTEIT